MGRSSLPPPQELASELNSLNLATTVQRITTEPEEILVADGDGRKEYAIGVDDFDVDGFGMAG